MNQRNIFIASSSELKKERNELVDLLQDLNRKHKAQDIKFKPVLWEYMDSSLRAERKEDEYLARLKECEICIVLFWNTLGQYTVEELDVAEEQMQAGFLPKQVFVFFKEPCLEMDEALVDFKAHFARNYPSVVQDIFLKTQELRDKVEQILL